MISRSLTSPSTTAIQLFSIPQGYHISAKGWIFYNRALDEFFHDAQPSALFGWRQKSD
ncbi:MAG TPA: hypothetical protein VIV62_02625 [Chthoniobacterales bacterium]|jgi:hypothetical protein